MGVYIKNMQMPEDNCEAIQQITITNNWIDGEIKILAYDSITNEFVGEVVEVPEPHGDLIDRDVLKRSVKDNEEYFRRGECCNYFYNSADEPPTELWCVDDWVDEQPTVIERSEDGKV